ncbi:MAG: hypothetical protein ACFCGT_23115 [Sandaracinaceae bacterium]
MSLRAWGGPPKRSQVAALAWGISVVAHVGAYGVVLYRTTLPDLGFELQLPETVEFGLSEAVEMGSGGRPEPASPEESEAAGQGQRAAPDAGVPFDAGMAQDAGPPDAGRRRRRRRDAGPPPVAARDEAERPGGDAEAEEGAVAFLPPGSQIALRIDVSRIRASPYADEVRALLAVLPDWTAILAGSGIDPLRDLDRILVASPNLRRSRLIVAGRAVLGADGIRAAATRLATGRGERLAWSEMDGVPVAPWRNADRTERVLALVGPRHFVICRPEDLPRVLAVAQARADDLASDAHPADALLAMGDGEGFRLEVEGARAFYRGPPERLARFPVSLWLALAEGPRGGVAGRSAWTYEDEEQAEAAQRFWDDARARFAANPLARVFGTAPILQAARLTATGKEVRSEVLIAPDDFTTLLARTRMLFAGERVDEAPTARDPGSGAGAGEPAPLEAEAGANEPAAPEAEASELGPSEAEAREPDPPEPAVSEATSGTGAPGASPEASTAPDTAPP